MMFPTLVTCGCKVHYYPNQVFIGTEPQPCLVVTKPCADHKWLGDWHKAPARAGMDELAYRWALMDAKGEFEQDEWRDEPWRAPYPKRIKWPNSARWWHRLHGHHTRARYDFMWPPYAWQCLECDLTVGHS